MFYVPLAFFFETAQKAKEVVVDFLFRVGWLICRGGEDVGFDWKRPCFEEVDLQTLWSFGF